MTDSPGPPEQNSGANGSEPTAASVTMLKGLLIAVIVVVAILGFLTFEVRQFGAETQRGADEAVQAHLERWKSAEGVITDTRFTTTRGRSRTPIYGAKYSYHVDGRFYEGVNTHVSVMEFGDGIFKQWSYEKPNLNAGDHVTVWYDPRNPSLSVLDKTIR